ncbi:MAG: hypothetical protein HQL54_04535 [Magnetococcales bacterium]|nr:hypothetical protein [Magnetococcales bacterium]
MDENSENLTQKSEQQPDNSAEVTPTELQQAVLNNLHERIAHGEPIMEKGVEVGRGFPPAAIISASINFLKTFPPDESATDACESDTSQSELSALYGPKIQKLQPLSQQQPC